MTSPIARLLRRLHSGSPRPADDRYNTLRIADRAPGSSDVDPGARRWHAFEARLADGVIKEGVICLTNGERITIGPGTPVILSPGDAISWRERHGWGWSAADEVFGQPPAATRHP